MPGSSSDMYVGVVGSALGWAVSSGSVASCGGGGTSVRGPCCSGGERELSDVFVVRVMSVDSACCPTSPKTLSEDCASVDMVAVGKL